MPAKPEWLLRLPEIRAQLEYLDAPVVDRAVIVAIAQPQPWYVDRAWMQAERERIVGTVREFHRRTSLLPGMARQELRGGAPVFVLDALLAGGKELDAEGELVRLREHKVVLKEDEE